MLSTRRESLERGKGTGREEAKEKDRGRKG
jgi:hypothetical protein